MASEVATPKKEKSDKSNENYQKVREVCIFSIGTVTFSFTQVSMSHSPRGVVLCCISEDILFPPDHGASE